MIVFTLMATDNTTASATGALTVTVQLRALPIANAGADNTATDGE
jgi:hypothetical protein